MRVRLSERYNALDLAVGKVVRPGAPRHPVCGFAPAWRRGFARGTATLRGGSPVAHGAGRRTVDEDLSQRNKNGTRSFADAVIAHKRIISRI